MKHKYDPKKLFVETYNYDDWYENEKLPDTTKTDENFTDLLPMPPL